MRLSRPDCGEAVTLRSDFWKSFRGSRPGSKTPQAGGDPQERILPHAVPRGREAGGPSGVKCGAKRIKLCAGARRQGGARVVKRGKMRAQPAAIAPVEKAARATEGGARSQSGPEHVRTMLTIEKPRTRISAHMTPGTGDKRIDEPVGKIRHVARFWSHPPQQFAGGGIENGRVGRRRVLNQRVGETGGAGRRQIPAMAKCRIGDDPRRDMQGGTRRAGKSHLRLRQPVGQPYVILITKGEHPGWCGTDQSADIVGKSKSRPLHERDRERRSAGEVGNDVGAAIA